MAIHIVIAIILAATFHANTGSLDRHENSTTERYTEADETTVTGDLSENAKEVEPTMIPESEEEHNVTTFKYNSSSITLSVVNQNATLIPVKGNSTTTIGHTPNNSKTTPTTTNISPVTPKKKPTVIPYKLQLALCIHKNRGFYIKKGKLTINKTISTCCSYKIFDLDLESLLARDVHAAMIIIDFWISIFITLIGLVGNVLSFVVLSMEQANTSIFLLKSLAITDALYCLWYLMFSPYNVAFQYTPWVSNKGSVAVHWIPLNKSMLGLVNFVLQTISIWLVVLLTIDRYIAVCYPFKAKILCTMNKVRIQLVVLVWLSVGFCIPGAFQSTPFLYQNPCTGALMVASNQTSFGKSYGSSMVYDIILDGFLRYIIPVTMVLAMNFLLTKALNKAAANRMQLSSDSNQKDNKNITLMLVTVATVFLILVLPQLAAKIMRTISRLQTDKQISLAIDESVLTHALQFVVLASNLSLRVNSSINFFLYIFVSLKFRRGFFKLIRCGRIHDIDSSSASPGSREMGQQSFRTRKTNFKSSISKAA